MRLSRTSACYHSRKRPALDTNHYFVIIMKSSHKRPRRLFWITQLDFSFVFKLSRLSNHSESSHTVEPPVSDLPKYQSRTQASSRYPSYQLNPQSPRTTGNEAVEMIVSQACNWSKSWLHPWSVSPVNGKHWLNFAKGKDLPVKTVTSSLDLNLTAWEIWGK